MPIYAVRTAVLQNAPAPLELVLAATATLTPLVIASSTYGERAIGDSNYTGSDATLATFTQTTSAEFPVSRAGIPPGDLGGPGTAINGRIVHNFGNLASGLLGVSQTLIPTSGSTSEVFQNVVFDDTGFFQTFAPPWPILNNAGDLRAAMTADTSVIPDPNAGMMNMIDTNNVLSIELKWEGYDLIVANYQINGVRPKDDGTGNWLVSTGWAQGTIETRPLLVDAQLNGIENGRYWIELDDPTWNAVLLQVPATRNIYQFFPCNAGWFATIKTSAVTPPSMFLFNEDFSEYWVYSFLGATQEVTDAISTVGWGNGGSEMVFIDAAITSQAEANTMQLYGADGNPFLFIGGQTPPSLRRLAHPYPAVYQPTCVPCAPLQIAGSTWQGRLA